MRKTITPEERLAVTLRFLATGNTYSDLAFTFRMHHSTISGIIPEVCRAIYQCLKSEYLRVPNTKGEWKEIADKTVERWQFPNCFGAADGKHVPTDIASKEFRIRLLQLQGVLQYRVTRHR